MNNAIYYPEKAQTELPADYLEEIKNTLKYTLRISEISDNEIDNIIQDGHPHENKQAIYIIDAVKKHTEKACGFLFGALPDFFGNSMDVGEVSPGESNKAGQLPTVKLRPLLMQSLFSDSLLSVYTYLRKTLCNGTISAYSAFKVSHYCGINEVTGLDHILKKGWYSFEIDKDRFKLEKKPPKGDIAQIVESGELAGRGSPFCRRLIDVDDFLYDQNSFSKIVNIVESEKDGKPYKNYYLSCDGLFVGSILCSHKASLRHLADWVKGGDKPLTRASLRADLETLEKEYRGSEFFCRSDEAYLESEIEKLFHGEVLESLWINMKEFAERNGIEFSSADLQTLALCMKLPLTPERPDIIRYAFDQKIFGTVSQEDFFSTLDDTTVMMLKLNPADQSQTMALWMNRYRYMMNYLADFAYPVYRSSFLVNLYKVICKIEQTDNVMVVIPKMYDCLRNCINFEHTDEEMQKYIDPLRQQNKRATLNDLQSEGKGKNADDGFGSFYKNCNRFFRELGNQDNHSSFLTLKELDRLSSNVDHVDKLYSGTEDGYTLIPDIIKRTRVILMRAAAHYDDSQRSFLRSVPAAKK